MTIIVSAFITNVNSIRSIDHYIHNGKKLLEVNSDFIIFLEKNVFELYHEFLFNLKEEEIAYNSFNINNKDFVYILFKNYTIILYEKTDIYLYNFKDEITEFNVNSSCPSKDTIEYMFVQCNKTEWVNFAIQITDHLKGEENRNYAWVDFGIYKTINQSDNIFKESFSKISNKYDKIRVPTCCIDEFYLLHDNYISDDTLYKNVQWFFSGSVFGGPSDKLIEFANLTKDKCLDIIKTKKMLMWEVNVWCFLYKTNPTLFSFYTGYHDITILSNY